MRWSYSRIILFFGLSVVAIVFGVMLLANKGTTTGNVILNNNPSFYASFEISPQAATNSGFSNFGAEYVSGKIGRGMYFDGNDRLEISSSKMGLAYTNELTISSWIYPRAGGFFVAKGSPFNWEYGIDFTDYGQIRLRLWSPSGSTNYASLKLNGELNKWQHVTFVIKNGAFVRGYINGVESGNTTRFYGNVVGNSKPLVVGRRSDGFGFKGTIDEIKIWNRALSSSEIAEEFRGSKVSPPTTNSYAIAHVFMTPFSEVDMAPSEVVSSMKDAGFSGMQYWTDSLTVRDQSYLKKVLMYTDQLNDFDVYLIVRKWENLSEFYKEVVKQHKIKGIILDDYSSAKGYGTIYSELKKVSPYIKFYANVYSKRGVDYIKEANGLNGFEPDGYIDYVEYDFSDNVKDACGYSYCMSKFNSLEKCWCEIKDRDYDTGVNLLRKAFPNAEVHSGFHAAPRPYLVISSEKMKAFLADAKIANPEGYFFWNIDTPTNGGLSEYYLHPLYKQTSPVVHQRKANMGIVKNSLQ